MKYKGEFKLFMPCNIRGFTLLELVMGIPLLLLVLTVVSVSIWDGVATFRLSAASQNLLHDIRYAQQQAMSQNGWYGIEFSPSPDNTYHVYSTNGTTDTDVVNPANRAAGLNINLKNQFSVAINSVNIGGGTKVEFNPMGEPYLDKNGSALSSNGSIVLGTIGKTKTIAILKTTGRAEIQ